MSWLKEISLVTQNAGMGTFRGRWAAGLLVVLAAAGCEEPAPAKDTAASAKPAAKKPPPKEETNEMPAVTVDNLGPYIGGERVDMKHPKGPEKLKDVVSKLPINGEQVELVILKKATTPDVMAVIQELDAAGAPTIKVKTDGRDDLPKELVLTPQSKAKDAPPCSVVSKVRQDLSIAVWAVEGGIASNHRKGFAGPDLSHSAKTMTKRMKSCESDYLFFTADGTVGWQMAFNLGGQMQAADEEKKAKHLVLLVDSPAAGRPVEL